METIQENRFRMFVRMTPDEIKAQDDRIRDNRLKFIADNLEIESLKYSLETTEAKKNACKIRIAVLELKKEQLLR